MKWYAEIEVSEVWVEDGFDLTKERLTEWLENALPFATAGEFSVKVSKQPFTQELK